MMRAYIKNNHILTLQEHQRLNYIILHKCLFVLFFFFSSRRRHTRWNCDWSSDVCSSDLDSAGTRVALGSSHAPTAGCGAVGVVLHPGGTGGIWDPGARVRLEPSELSFPSM